MNEMHIDKVPLLDSHKHAIWLVADMVKRERGMSPNDIAVVVVDLSVKAFRRSFGPLVNPLSQCRSGIMVIRRTELMGLLLQFPGEIDGPSHPLQHPIRDDQVWVAALGPETLELANVSVRDKAPSSSTPQAEGIAVAVLLEIGFGGRN